MTGTDERAVSGRWFEELEVGTMVRHANRRTVTETDNVLFTTMTMNPAPLHLDADYAASTEFGRPLVNSMFTVALVVGLSVPELTLGTIVAQLGLDNVSFPKPVFPGDTVRVETEVVAGPAFAITARRRSRRVRASGLQPARRVGLPGPADRPHALATSRPSRRWRAEWGPHQEHQDHLIYSERGLDRLLCGRARVIARRTGDSRC